jgi:sugar phosphate isomerase/epimerase
MEIGIFTKVFPRPTLAETLDAVRAAGIGAVQFDLADAGLPEQLDPAVAKTIGQTFRDYGIVMAAVSGTYNIIHHDPAHRQAGLSRLRALAGMCDALGTSVMTLSTGTRNRENMWHAHPDNATPEAWAEARAALHEIAAIGAQHGITMAFEPEVNNVVDGAQRARRMLDEVGSPFLKVVMDGANIFHAGELPAMAAILDEAFALLGNDIALAHAKDLDHDGDAGHLPAGHGLLDYDRYLRGLRTAGYSGPLVLHGLAEAQVAGCVAFLNERIAAVQERQGGLGLPE